MTSLNEQQQRWCVEQGIGMGYDDDDPNLVQFSHLVEFTVERRPYTDGTPGDYPVEAALCRSERLWFGQGPGFVWPVVDVDKNVWAWFNTRHGVPLAEWTSITCEACCKIAIDRGMPKPKQPTWVEATDAQRVELLFRTLTCVRVCCFRLTAGEDSVRQEIDALVNSTLDEVEQSGYQGIELPGDLGPDDLEELPEKPPTGACSYCRWLPTTDEDSRRLGSVPYGHCPQCGRKTFPFRPEETFRSKR